MPARFGIAAMGSSTRTWLVNEDCEGTGTPSGWTDDTGTPNWDYTAVPLEGSQSLYLSIAAAAHRTFIDFGDRDEVYIYFLMRYTNGAAPAAGRNFVTLARGGAFTATQSMTINSALKLTIGASTINNATAADTTYNIWMHYLKGTGANAVLDIGYSTNGVRPTSGGTFAQQSNGSQTFQIGRLALGTTASNVSEDFIFDKIRVSDTLIGDNGA